MRLPPVWSALVLLVLLAPGCQSVPTLREDQLPLPAAGTTDLSGEELIAARRLCLTKCIRCHKFYRPGEYDEQTWQTWMTKMSRKAQLKPEQESLLRRYLGAVRTSPKP